MTEQEALYYIDCAINYILGDTLDYEEAKKYSSHCHTTFGIFVALKEALEKQIPKKPKQGSVKVGGLCVTGQTCPNCQHMFGTVLRHCPNCGQKIDWSDSKVTPKEELYEEDTSEKSNG